MHLPHVGTALKSTADHRSPVPGLYSQSQTVSPVVSCCWTSIDHVKNIIIGIGVKELSSKAIYVCMIYLSCRDMNDLVIIKDDSVLILQRT